MRTELKCSCVASTDLSIRSVRVADEILDHVFFSFAGFETMVPTCSPASTRAMLPGASSKTWIGRSLSMQSDSAVVSITFNPRSIACKWVSCGNQLRVGIDARVAVEHTRYPVLGHQDRLGPNLERPQRGGRVGREVRVARACREDHDAALLEMPLGAAADVRLGDLLHLDRRHDARVGAVPLERLLDGESVQHRAEHAHVVAGRPVHARRRGGHAAVDVAAADHDRELGPARAHGDELERERVDRVRIDARTPASPISASPESFSRTRLNGTAEATSETEYQA